MTNFPGADATSQWFADEFESDHMKPNVLCLHTTEGSSWPGYNGGATAPNNTIMPNLARRRLEFRQHYPLEYSSRALRNEWGGVETNTLNVIQWELVGTCVKGGPGLYWPDAPEWCYRELGEKIAQLHELFPAIRLEAPRLWLPHPDSYGATRARMTFAQWRNFYGICGHQHVPENVHGDPGNLPMNTILKYARNYLEEEEMNPADIWKYPIKQFKSVDPDQQSRPAWEWLLRTFNVSARNERRLQAVIKTQRVLIQKADNLSDAEKAQLEELLKDATIDVDVTVHTKDDTEAGA